MPSWVQNVMQAPTFWLLKKCLPGQRNVVTRWSNKFRSVSEQHGFESFPGMLTIFRRVNRGLFLTIHVGDILLVGSGSDIQWYDETFKGIFTMKNSETCSIATEATCMLGLSSQAPRVLI